MVNLNDAEAEQLREKLQDHSIRLKEDFNENNVIYQLILHVGFDLNSKIEEIEGIKKISDESRIFYITFADTINEDFLVEHDISQDAIIFCKDSSLSDDVKINLKKIYANLQTI